MDSIYPLTVTFGLSGTATAVTLGVSATMPIWWHISSRIIRGSYVALLKGLLPSLAGTAVMSAGILAAKHWIGQVDIAGFVVLVLVGAALYTVFLIFLWRWFQYGPVGSLPMLRRSFFGGVAVEK